MGGARLCMLFDYRINMVVSPCKHRVCISGRVMSGNGRAR